jgi:hypothetical protein
MPLTIADAMPRKKYGETSFGERLQAIRRARGLTQVQLAEAAVTTQRAVSYYETCLRASESSLMRSTLGGFTPSSGRRATSRSVPWGRSLISEMYRLAAQA